VSFQKIFRGVCKSLVLFAGVAVMVASFGVSSVGAQDALDRKVKSKVAPLYPEIARKMNLAGVVKLEVVVLPNGTVKETKVIGGNPILVNAAVDAVKKWKFETASDESTGVVEFKFDPSN
jgi:TonB family protein